MQTLTGSEGTERMTLGGSRGVAGEFVLPYLGQMDLYQTLQPDRRKLSTVCTSLAVSPGSGLHCVKVSEITDGTSEVLMVGEREHKGLAATRVGAGNARGFGPADNCATLVSLSFVPNCDIYDLYGTDNRGKGPGSQHPNGAPIRIRRWSGDVLSPTVAPS